MSVVAVGALCELDDDDTYVLPFVYDCPALRPPVMTPPTPADTETRAPDTELPPLRRWFERGSEQRPYRLFGRRLELATPAHRAGYQHRPITYQQRRIASRKRRGEGDSLSFTEFADLSDGQRVVLRNDRGHGCIWGNSPGPWPGLTRQNFADDIRDWFAQLEEDRATSPEWVVDFVARLYDIKIDLASVKAALQAPRRVEFGPRLAQQLPP
ncbi:MAG: hypothetical protein F4X37_04820 [Acidimicrobiia bacterium]|nr:hypothetical protein [Acidimicrobiia bacterium]